MRDDTDAACGRKRDSLGQGWAAPPGGRVASGKATRPEGQKEHSVLADPKARTAGTQAHNVGSGWKARLQQGLPSHHKEFGLQFKPLESFKPGSS